MNGKIVLFNFILIIICSKVTKTNGALNFTSDCKYKRQLTFTEMRRVLAERVDQAKVFYKDYNNRDLVKNMTFKVVIENIEPYVYINITNGEIHLSGYVIEIWKTLEEGLKFKSEYIILPSCKGKVALKTGEADIMLTPAVISGEDLDEYDHSMPVASSWSEFYIKRKEIQASSLSYITAWDIWLWSAFILTFILLSIFSWSMGFIRVICCLEPEDCKDGINNNRIKKDTLPFKNKPVSIRDYLQKCPSFGGCLFEVWSAVTQQGTTEPLKSSSSSHIISLVVIMFGWLMYTSYSAALVSRLAVRKVEPSPFSTLSEAAIKRTHSICTRTNNFAYSTLFKAKTTDTTIMPKWVGIVNAPPCVSDPRTSEDIQRSICHKDAITLETTSLMTSILSPRLPCIANKMIKGRYAYVYISLLVRKGFPFNRLLSSYLLRLHCSGLIQKLQQKYLHKKIHLKTVKYKPEITINHVESIIHLYGGFIFLSFLILCFEIIFNHIELIYEKIY